MPPSHPSILVPAMAGLLLASGLPAALADEPRARGVAAEVADPGPSKDEYRARRRALMEKIKAAEAGTGALGRADEPGTAGVVIVLLGAPEPGEDARFRQENDFSYLTGVDVPHASVILWPESGVETLYLPPRNPARERFDGPTPGPGTEAAATLGFARIESSRRFLAELFRAIGDPGTGRARAATVYLIEPTSRPTSAAKGEHFARFVRQGAPRAWLKDVAPPLHEMRKVKSEAEAVLLRRAVALTADAQREVIRLIAPGVTEYRLEGAILSAFVSGGGARAGFPSIVGSGPNSTVLHYNKNDRTLRDGDLVVVDIGGEYRGYTADITRTYPASGRFTPRQREVYQLVLDAQSAAVADFKPGVSTIASLNRATNRVLRDSPLRAKDEEGTDHAMDHFFIHGLGHHLGLDVHDVGDATRPLGPGEVFTIEPGLYLPAEGFGVRIEDDYRVTPDGLDKLSRDIPVDPDEIERLISRARGHAATAPPSPTTP